MDYTTIVKDLEDFERKWNIPTKKFRDAFTALPAVMAKVEDLTKLEAKLSPIVERLRKDQAELSAQIEADTAKLAAIRTDLAQVFGKLKA